MFYIERSLTGPCLCSDLHDCLGMDSEGLGWYRNGSKALAFPTKEEAEDTTSPSTKAIAETSIVGKHPSGNTATVVFWSINYCFCHNE